MSMILQDLSSTSLADAIEANLFSFLPYNHKWPRATVREDSEIFYVMTDIPSPLFNTIAHAQLPLDKINGTIDSIVNQANRRKISLLWWTGPATKPPDLAEYLEKRGFVRAGQSPGMAVDLENLRDDRKIPEGLTVQQVETKESLRRWCQVLGDTFGMSDSETEAYYDFLQYMDSNKTVAYLGMVNNQPVATSLLHLGAGVAGIYSVATIPEERRRGIGAWMTMVPLREAQNRDYKIGVLQSSEMSVGVYRSFGFQEYCTIGQYLWSPE